MKRIWASLSKVQGLRSVSISRSFQGAPRSTIQGRSELFSVMARPAPYVRRYPLGAGTLNGPRYTISVGRPARVTQNTRLLCICDGDRVFCHPCRLATTFTTKQSFGQSAGNVGFGMNRPFARLSRFARQRASLHGSDSAGLVRRLCSPVFADHTYVYLDPISAEPAEKISIVELRDVAPIDDAPIVAKLQPT